MADEYPVPSASPLVDIAQWRGLLLAAIDAALDRADVWDDADVDTALGYVQDLKLWASLLGGGVITDIRTVNGQLQVQRDGGGSWAAVTDANYVRADGSVAMTDKLTVVTQSQTALDLIRTTAADISLDIASAANADSDYSILLLASDRSLRIRNNATGWDSFQINPGVTNLKFVNAGGSAFMQKTDATANNKAPIWDLIRDGGTPVANYGLMQRLRLQNASGTLMTVATIEAYWDDPAAAQAKTSYRITLTDQAATREVLHMQADHSKALISVLGAAPVGRQTISGAKGGNTALASVIALLVAFGYGIDTTT